MFKFALKNIQRYKSRFLLTTLTIIFGVSFATSVIVISGSLNRTLIDISNSVENDSIDIIVDSKHDFYPNYQDNDISPKEETVKSPIYNSDIATIKEINDPLIDNVLGWLEYRSFSDNFSSNRIVIKKDNKILFDNPDSYSFQNQAQKVITNYYDQSKYNSFNILEGRLPSAESEIVIDKFLAEEKEIFLGDVLNIEILDNNNDLKRSLIYKVVGFNQSKTDYILESFGIGKLIPVRSLELFIINETSLRDILDLPENTYTSAGIYLNQSSINALDEASGQAAKDKVFNKIDSLYRDDYYVHYQNFDLVSSLTDDLSFLINALRNTLLFFISFAMLVGIIVVINTFNIIIVQRVRELALLRAIAFSKKRIFRLVVAEAFISGIIASLIGIILGCLLAIGLWVLIDSSRLSFNLDLYFSPLYFIFPLILGLLVTLIAAYSPARKASKLSIIEGLTETHAISKKSLLARIILGSILGFVSLIVAGLIFIIIFSNADKSFESWQVSLMIAGLFFSFVVLFFASLVFMPLIIKFFSRIFELVLSPILKQIKLSTVNLRKDAIRSATTTNALVIGVVLIVFLTIFIGSFEKSVVTNLAQFNNYNLAVEDISDPYFPTKTNPHWQSIYQDLKNAEEVSDVSIVKYLAIQQQANDKILTIGIVDPNTINQVLNIDLTNQQIQALNNGNALASDDYDQFTTVETYIILDNKRLEYNYTIGGTIEYPNILPSSEIDLMISDDFSEHYNDFNVDFLLNANDDYSDDQIIKALNEITDNYSGYVASGIAFIIDNIRTGLNIVLNILIGLFGLSIFIAFIGIFNTMSLSILERFREIGILRVNGMTKRQIKTMINLEAMMLVIIGATIGFLLGFLFSGLLFYFIKTLLASDLQSEGQVLYFSLPYSDIIIFYAVVIVVALLAAFWPARKAAKLAIVKAISHIG